MARGSSVLEQGWRVEIIDDLSTGGIENIAHLKGHSHFSYVLHAVMDRPVMLELVDRTDVLFHLAAAVGVRMVVERPVHTIQTNIKASELVLELTARKQKPVLLTSTSEVYGRLDKAQFNEDDDQNRRDRQDEPGEVHLCRETFIADQATGRARKTRRRPTTAIAILPVFLLLAMVAAKAVCVGRAALNARFRDVRHTLPFLTQFWLLATPIALSEQPRARGVASALRAQIR